MGRSGILATEFIPRKKYMLSKLDSALTDKKWHRKTGAIL
jgi:hypothetical protein